MSALTAPPNPTIPTTASTATADGATSPTPLRIDTFIKSKLQEARSDGFSGLKSSAEAAQSHGFTACANSRYAAFLEAMVAAQDQVTYYAEKYPACFFLPWTALNATMKALNLWCDLPRHYTGAIPPGQLPYLDIFSLDPNDAVPPVQMLELIDDGLRKDVWQALIRNAATSHKQERSAEWEWQRQWDFDPYESNADVHNLFRNLDGTQQTALRTACADFQSSWFVIAPPAAFNVSEDWRSRTRKLLTQAAAKKEPPPDDPLVVRFVRHGCLVVAAWGEEAAELNAAVNSLNI
jgi:hypothetical protein